jgi:hypothetical protein
VSDEALLIAPRTAAVQRSRLQIKLENDAMQLVASDAVYRRTSEERP